MLFEMTAFRGWDLSSAWNEVKFEARHRNDLERVAVVGSRKWEEWAAMLSKFFTGTDVRYFDEEHVIEARAWLESGW